MFRYEARHIPNTITVIRILLVYPVVQGLLAGNYGMALGFFMVAGVSDAVDGFLARHFHWQSKLGSLLDPIADKLLILCCFAILGAQGHIPLWLTVAVFVRDGFILIGATAYYFALRPFEGDPLLISKLNTLLQLMLIVAVLFDLGVMPAPDWGLLLLIAAVTLTTVASGVLYVVSWGRLAWFEWRQKHGKRA